MKIAGFTSLFILMILFSSCGTYVYKSVTAKTPLLAERNDFNGQLNVSAAGGEAYAAYAPVKYLGFSLSYAGGSQNSDSAQSTIIRKFRDFEWSLIPFYSEESLRLEMPFGTGFSAGTNGSQKNAYALYTRSFIQPTVAYHTDVFEVAMFCRFSRINYADARWGTDTRFEPGITIKAGSENIKGLIQLRVDQGTNYSRTVAAGLLPSDQVLYFPWHFSFGVNFGLNFGNE